MCHRTESLLTWNVKAHPKTCTFREPSADAVRWLALSISTGRPWAQSGFASPQTTTVPTRALYPNYYDYDCYYHYHYCVVVAALWMGDKTLNAFSGAGNGQSTRLFLRRHDCVIIITVIIIIGSATRHLRSYYNIWFRRDNRVATVAAVPPSRVAVAFWERLGKPYYFLLLKPAYDKKKKKNEQKKATTPGSRKGGFHWWPRWKPDAKRISLLPRKQVCSRR